MKVVSVKFKENGRAYYFDPGEFKIKEGDFVVVTTARGTECGEVVRAAHEVPGFSTSPSGHPRGGCRGRAPYAPEPRRCAAGVPYL